MPDTFKEATISFNFTDEIGNKLAEFMDQQVEALKDGVWSGNPSPGITITLDDGLEMTNIKFINKIDYPPMTEDLEEIFIVVHYHQYII